MTPTALRKLALARLGAHEEPHFERTSFRVGKKIFATMTADSGEAMVRVRPPEKLDGLLSAFPAVFFSYGTWTAKNGALGVRLARVDAKVMRALVEDSWRLIAPTTGKPSSRRTRSR